LRESVNKQPSGSEHWREKMGHSNAAGIDAVPGSPVDRMDLYNVQRPIRSRKPFAYYISDIIVTRDHSE
jgi:hypothetical protein